MDKIGLNPHGQALYVLLCENNNTEKQTFDSHCLSCLFIKRPNSVQLIMFLSLSRTLHGICQFRFFEFKYSARIKDFRGVILIT